MDDVLQTKFPNAYYFNRKVLYLDWNFTEVVPKVSNWQSVTIGTGNGLAPKRCQTITWTNDELFYWRIYAAIGLNL